ncbi:hypothetical protein BDZ45DRAFT_781234 [Acephala macrosclerotiorum]|nr:hypothetical protein BDZ45DRAFT_781234 [Acephala macrosclerotiorum]
MADNTQSTESRPLRSESKPIQTSISTNMPNRNTDVQSSSEAPQASGTPSQTTEAHLIPDYGQEHSYIPSLSVKGAPLSVFNRWYPECPQKHTVGLFCWACRSQPMEWLPGAAPFVTNDNGEQIIVGPRWGMVEGVDLLDKEAIAVMTVVTYLDAFTYRYTDVPGFLELIKKYPKSVEAGQRIADVYQALRRKALDPEDRNPEFHEIIHRALLEPHLRADEYELNVLGSFAPTPKEFANVEAAGDEDGSNDHHDSAPYDDLLMQSRPILSAAEYHVPGPRAEGGDWEFVEGTDLSKAVLGEPEPHKFFLIRRKRSDPSVEDIREYPGWKGFDWRNPDSIDALNKHRHQVAYRMGKRSADPRPPWTLREKDYLKNLIKAEIDAGKTRQKIDWDDIATRHAAGFEGVVQKKGAPLAVKSELDENNVWVTPEEKASKLSKDREGPIARTGGAVKTQAGKYHDICKILDQSGTPKKALKRKRRSGNEDLPLKTDKGKNQKADKLQESDGDLQTLSAKVKGKEKKKEQMGKLAKMVPGGSSNRPPKGSRQPPPGPDGGGIMA